MVMGPGCGQSRRRSGFSLGEMLAVVIIGSMILVAILTVYNRANQAADAVLRKIDSPAWAQEVLQLIAEDLGRALSADDVTVQIRNGPDEKGFQRAEVVLRHTYHDSENKEQPLEEITWRAAHDYEATIDGLMLYRSYQGVGPEDKLFDDNREDWEKSYPFVPICRGITFFKIQACKGEDLLDQWPASPPPPGVKITISFASRFKRVSGGYDVDDSEKICRTVVLDPTRKIQFASAAGQDANAPVDPNAPVRDTSWKSVLQGPIFQSATAESAFSYESYDRWTSTCTDKVAISDGDHRGVILLVTLVILVILATLGYTLCVQVAARRHRDQYVIDYSIARHACVSGLKYALASMNSLQFDLVSRPNEPDFSDLFALPEDQYQKLVDQLAAKLAADNGEALATSGEKPGAKDAQKPGDGNAGKTAADRDSLKKTAQDNAGAKAAGKDSETKTAQKNLAKKSTKGSVRKSAARGGDVNDINDVNDWGTTGGSSPVRSRPQIRGPYGPPWPLVTEPMEFEIGPAKVKIEVEDENAKYPLGWAMLADEKLKPIAVAGWMTFCEWMGYTPAEISAMNEDLAKIGKTKPFKTEFKPETENVPIPASAKDKITRPTTAAVARRTASKKPVTVEEQIDRQNTEYAKLMHSSLINRDLLSRPSIASDTRQESALKYLGLWAARSVNVNTAPRQVLEAALTFGSTADAPKIAQAIIQHRRDKPIADVNELKQTVSQYSSAIDDCRTFLTAKSTVFTIRVTAISGVATVTAVAAVNKEGDKVQPIAVISE